MPQPWASQWVVTTWVTGRAPLYTRSTRKVTVRSCAFSSTVLRVMNPVKTTSACAPYSASVFAAHEQANAAAGITHAVARANRSRDEQPDGHRVPARPPEHGESGDGDGADREQGDAADGQAAGDRPVGAGRPFLAVGGAGHRLARCAQHPRHVGCREVAPAGVGDQPGHGLVAAALDALDGEDQPGGAELRGQAALGALPRSRDYLLGVHTAFVDRVDREPDVGPGVLAAVDLAQRGHRPPEHRIGLSSRPGRRDRGALARKGRLGVAAAPARPSTTAATRASNRGASLTWPVSAAGGGKQDHQRAPGA